MPQVLQHKKNRWVPMYFVLFFGVIMILDGIFVTVAIRTQTGVVTDNAYEKGLAYNELLQAARSQPALSEQSSYSDGYIVWRLRDSEGEPITNAQVRALIKRPVQEGYDFEVFFEHTGHGEYRAGLSLPMRGLWVAQMQADWDDQKFRKSFRFVDR